ncbi:MAG: DUF3352 domain-containing protein [Anaerolineae bacterium]|nr:DUF3352 domain-containing protein [Anaerolineae bacterium]
MKRLVLLIVALLLVGAILPVAAQSTPDLVALAAYYPQNTALYAAFRTDDAFVDEMDAMRAHIEAVLPAGAMDGTTLREALDAMAGQASSGETFDAAVRSWLGDSASFGALSMETLVEKDDDGPFLIAISITDRAAAQAFFERIAPADQLVIDEQAGYTLITPANPDESAAVYLDDQVLILTNKPEALPIGGMPSPSLVDNAQFQSALAALPEPSYGLLGYVDYHAMVEASLSEMRDSAAMSASMGMNMAMLEPMLDAIGGMGLGLTVLDGRSLTADISLGMDMSAMGDMAVDMTAFAPFDPAFAEHLPAGTQLAMQGTDLAASIEQGLANMARMAETVPEQSGRQGSPEEVLAGLNLAFRGMTGMELDDAVLSWMTGQYAFGFSFDFDALLQAGPEDMARLMQFAFIAENTTGEGAQALVAGLQEGLAQLATLDRSGGITISEETIGGAPAILISVTSRGMRDPFEIVIGGNESVFVIGTPDMARQALSPDGGLNGDAGYQEAAALALTNSPVLLYGSGDMLNAIIELGMLGRSAYSGSQELEVGPIFSSLGMSAVYNDVTVSTRMALTLASQ